MHEAKVIRIVIGAMLLVLITAVSITALADDLFIFPSKNQSAERQDKDKWECRAWATKQTGFDSAARVNRFKSASRTLRGHIGRGLFLYSF